MAAADAALAGSLGVAPRVIVDLRAKLTLGVHWLRDEAGKVSYTFAGEARVREMVVSGKTSLDAPEVAVGIVLQTVSRAFTLWIKEEKHGLDCMLTIVKCPANLRFVQVRAPDGALVKVRVKSGEKLRPRIQLRCRQLADGRWECRQPGFAAASTARKIGT